MSGPLPPLTEREARIAELIYRALQHTAFVHHAPAMLVDGGLCHEAAYLVMHPDLWSQIKLEVATGSAYAAEQAGHVLSQARRV